jgi:hypothetical protein
LNEYTGIITKSADLFKTIQRKSVSGGHGGALRCFSGFTVQEQHIALYGKPTAVWDFHSLQINSLRGFFLCFAIVKQIILLLV